jgi:hypothetical protein
VPEQPPPLQPAKTEPVDGVAVSVTSVLTSNETGPQAPPQSMPAGLLLTVPLPAPVLFTASGTVVGANVAVRVAGEVPMLTVQGFVVPLRQPLPPLPLQPVNVEPEAGVTVSVTDWSGA